MTTKQCEEKLAMTMQELRDTKNAIGKLELIDNLSELIKEYKTTIKAEYVPDGYRPVLIDGEVIPQYFINEIGDVWSQKRCKVLSPGFNKLYKCYQCLLSIDKKIVPYSVHYLVASTFIPNPEGYTKIMHVNGNRHDNSVKNLAWCEYDPEDEESMKAFYDLRKKLYKERFGKEKEE